MSQENSMGKFVCSLSGKDAWTLPPGEASKQTFETKEEAVQWFREKYPENKLEVDGYVDQDHTVHIIETDGKSIGTIDEYP